MAITRQTKAGKIPIFSKIERNRQEQRKNRFGKVNNNHNWRLSPEGMGVGEVALVGGEFTILIPSKLVPSDYSDTLKFYIINCGDGGYG